MPDKSLSKLSAQICAWSRTRISSAEIRTRPASPRALPSRM